MRKGFLIYVLKKTIQFVQKFKHDSVKERPLRKGEVDEIDSDRGPASDSKG